MVGVLTVAELLFGFQPLEEVESGVGRQTGGAQNLRYDEGVEFEPLQGNARGGFPGFIVQ